MQFDIFNPCSSSLVCAAHFKPWSSATRGGEVGEQVGAPLVCEGLGRAGCGMDAQGQDKEMALLLCCHCSPGCLTYSYLHTCPTQTRASPPSFQERSALQAGCCWRSVPQQQPQLLWCCTGARLSSWSGFQCRTDTNQKQNGERSLSIPAAVSS